MIAAEDDALERKIHVDCNVIHQGNELCGGLTGIPAELINLIGRRFDHEQAIVSLRL